jgi:hypothetical protein
MAINYSNHQYDRAIKIAYGKYYPLNASNFVKVVFCFILRKYFFLKWSIFNVKQSLLQCFFRKKINCSNINFKLEKKVFIKESDELSLKGYTFVENFFDKETHNVLLKNFPSFSNFMHIKKITKNYFFCYRYDNSMMIKDIKNIEYNYEYNEFVKYLVSEKFTSELENLLFKDKLKYKLKTFLCSFKRKGSFLIPHKDSIFNSTDKTTYNFIYFIDGNNKFPNFSAATGIYNDNNFSQPLLIPNNLNNSCLVYKTSNTKNFFHGFDEVKSKGFAKVCTFHYVNSDTE